MDASMYNMSEFLTTIKEDIGIDDIALPVSDADIIKRIERSALRHFSQRAPYTVPCILTPDHIEEEFKHPLEGDREQAPFVRYRIPEYKYTGRIIIGLSGLTPINSMASTDFYVPMDMAIDSQIAAMASLKAASTSASYMGRKPTKRFIKPNIVDIFYGWSSANWETTLLLTHDISLSTVPNDAYDSLRELCIYDVEWYLYNKMKRKNGINSGNGTFDLKIDDWADAQSRFFDLLKQWDEDGASLDYASIHHY